MRKRRWGRKRRDPLKGMAAGAIAGLVASFVMNQAMRATQALKQSWQRKQRIVLVGQQGDEQKPPEQAGQQEQESEDATQKAAEKVVNAVLHRPLSKEKKKIAGPVVHYAFGTAMGAAYGAAVEELPVNKVLGVPFGAAVWLAADEIGVPAAGLSKPPTAYPPSVHVNALAAHLAYGLTTELVRRGVRSML